MAEKLPLPPHRVRLPDAAGLFKTWAPDDRAFMLELVAAIQREFDNLTNQRTALPAMMLLSPDHSSWRVTVTDAGTLAAEKLGNLTTVPP